MSFKAYALVNEAGVLFVDRQLLIFPRRVDAEKKRAELYADDSLGDEFDGRIERVLIDKQEPRRRK